MLIQPVTQIQRPGVIMLTEDYRQHGICVPKGYLYDGASIPRFAWSIIGLSPFGEIIGAATLHDWSYVNGGWVSERLWMSKADTDLLFKAMMLEAGIPTRKAWLAYKAVKHFGKGAF